MAASEIAFSTRQQLQELIHSRPNLQALEVGYHVRNQAEIQDLSMFVQENVAVRYIGLAGSRQVGKILIPRQKLPETVTDPLPEQTVVDIVGKLAHIADRVHGCARIVHRPARRTAVPPTNAFMYDIDVVVVPEDASVTSSVEPRIGVKSGTHFDIITVSQSALARTDGFFRSAFLNSRRLLFV